MNYRVWNDEDKQMEKVTEISIRHGNVIGVSSIDKDGEEAEWIAIPPMIKGSGLTDNDGVEIFESDYISGFRNPVIFEDGCFFVTDECSKRYPLFELNLMDYKISGNCYKK